MADCCIFPIGCGSHGCKHCAWGISRKWQALLHERYKLKKISKVGFLTLTIDPKRFGAGDDGYRTIMGARVISECLRYFGSILGNRRGGLVYHAVKQFHSKSGNLHVHILIDGLGFIPKPRIRKLQRWCQEHCGTCDYKFKDCAEAVGYAARYVSRPGEIPEWVKGPQGVGFKWSSSSHGFWPEAMRSERFAVAVVDWRAYPQTIDKNGSVCFGGVPEHVHEQMDLDEAADRAAARSRPRTMAEREQSCGRACVVMERKPLGMGWKFKGTLPIAYWDLKTRAFLEWGLWEAHQVDPESSRLEFWIDGEQVHSVASGLQYLNECKRDGLPVDPMDCFFGVDASEAGGGCGGGAAAPPASGLSLDTLNCSVDREFEPWCGVQAAFDDGWIRRVGF